MVAAYIIQYIGLLSTVNAERICHVAKALPIQFDGNGSTSPHPTNNCFLQRRALAGLGASMLCPFAQNINNRIRQNSNPYPDPD